MTISMTAAIKAVWARENRRIMASKWHLSLVTWLPLVCMLVLYAIFSSGVPRDLPIAVVDQNHSNLSRSLTRYIDSSPSLAVTQQLSSLQTGKELMQSGEVYGLLVIPRDFDKLVVQGKSPQVTSFYNAQYVLIGKLVASNMSRAFATFTAKMDAMRTLAAGGNIASLKGAVAPISTQVSPLYNLTTNYVPFLVTAAVPALWQVFIVIAVILAFGMEYKYNNQEQWFAAANDSVVLAVIGKLLPYTLIALFQGMLFLGFFYGYLSWPMHGQWLYLLLGILFAVFAGQAIGLLIFTLTMNVTQAISMGAAYSAPAFAFVGITFPAESMPALAQIWRTLLPITHYMQLQIGQVNYAQGFMILLPQLGALALFVLTSVISVNKLIKHREKTLAEVNTAAVNVAAVNNGTKGASDE